MRLLLASLLAVLVVQGSGCAPAPEPAPEVSDDESIGFELRALNYTDVPIATYFVDDEWGGDVMPHTGGSSSAGSIGLPFKWRPGLKVKVRWQDDTLRRTAPNALHEAELEVPPYERIYVGFLLVAFEPGGKVRIRASSYPPGMDGSPSDFPSPAPPAARTSSVSPTSRKRARSHPIAYPSGIAAQVRRHQRALGE
ncbi:DUF3304 domain-containing protein [Montanilutibacter psychrotolerans]|nr:DUF3304 domain-containing protein [Lysobacter psychrotolerans]